MMTWRVLDDQPPALFSLFSQNGKFYFHVFLSTRAAFHNGHATSVMSKSWTAHKTDLHTRRLCPKYKYLIDI